MGYSSRRPHRVPLLSAKNRKRRLQFTQAHQNWTIDDWKNVAWSDESRFLLQHSDCRVRIWRKKTWKHGSILPCLNGSGWWWCSGVGDIYGAFTLHGTARYGSLLGGFPLGTVPGTFLVPPRPGFQAIRTVTKTWRVNSADHWLAGENHHYCATELATWDQ